MVRSRGIYRQQMQSELFTAQGSTACVSSAYLELLVADVQPSERAVHAQGA